MNPDDLGREAGRATRSAAGRVPDLDAVLARHRRRRAVAAGIGALVVVLGIGGLALVLTRPAAEIEAANTTTTIIETTTVADDDTATTSTTEPLDTSAATTTTATVPATTLPPSPPGYGGTAVIGDDQGISTFNPYVLGGDHFALTTLGQALWAKPMDVEAVGLEIVPDLVTEIPSVGNGGLVVNDDGTMTVTYRIRSEAVWADGTPISGADFAFTYQTIVNLPRNQTQATLFEVYDQIVPGSEVVGDKMYSFSMGAPTLRWQELFDPLIPKHDVEGKDFEASFNDQPWMSAGPFVFSELERDPIYGLPTVTLVRNANYWKVDPATGMQLPYLDSIEFRAIPETELLTRAFLERTLDVMNPPPSNDVVAELEASGADVQVRSGPIWEHFSFQFGENNRNPESMNTITDFRRAVAYAIDREEILAGGIWTGREVLDSPFDVGSASLGTSAWSQYRYDPVLAQELLAAACKQVGRDCEANPPVVIFSTTSNAEERPRVANLVQEMLAEVGIIVELQLEDSCVFFGPTLDEGNWDMGMWAWVNTPGAASAVGVLELFDPTAPPPDGSNYYRWGTPEVSGAEPSDRPGCGSGGNLNQGPSLVVDEHTERYAELMEAIRTTIDVDELRPLVAEAEGILADQVVVLPLTARGAVGAVWPDEIGNYVHNPSRAAHTWNIEFWYRTDRG